MQQGSVRLTVRCKDLLEVFMLSGLDQKHIHYEDG